MSSTDIITKLKSPHVREQLQSLSIKHLWLFGSHAKQTSNTNSDIDLIYEIDPHVSQSNF
jgi:predicted nucleotidyltransferase